MGRTVAVLLLTSCGITHLALAGPYAPAAGQPGSTAIAKNDPAIVAWATGHENYSFGPNVDLSWRTPDKALGPAVGDSFDVVSLGDGGQITLNFAQPIFDGPGSDFAVFENGFSDTFLELAYVEVSSNGTDFFRFASDSLTPGPVGGFGSVDPTNLSGLAGKYRQAFGTPFDLSELAAVSPLLDIHHIGYVRIRDIVGDGTYTDTSGSVIYDLYPTTGSGGFDLDAVAVIHAVPEPAGVVLLAAAMLGAVLSTRRSNTKRRRHLSN